MLKFILNEQTIETELAPGMTVLDFVRYRQDLKGTKIGCREGDCGACTVLVGELGDDKVSYRSMTSCLMPLANAAGKHIVTVEGVNPPDGGVTPVQKAMIDQSGTQCGFCTVGFVMSLTGFCLDDSPKTCQSAVSAMDGNICRCTGYKSIERAACAVAQSVSATPASAEASLLENAVSDGIVPNYFSFIPNRLRDLSSVNRKSQIENLKSVIAGGTDLYVQRPEEMAETTGNYVFDNSELRTITETETHVEIGASAVVTDLMNSPICQRLFPQLYKHLKLISSTPIRNMATIAGNFVNASPIGDMTAWFLALDAEVQLSGGNATVMERADRWLPLREFYLGYKQLAKNEGEIITSIRFKKDFTHFNFEKVCKRTYLDIASVNTAISLRVSGPSVSAGFGAEEEALPNGRATDTTTILEAHVSAGGVAPTPLYLAQTSEFLRGKEINETVIDEAAAIIQTEISPISDVRGSEEYKRLLLQQLFKAHFVELFG